MGKLKKIITSLHTSTNRNYISRMNDVEYLGMEDVQIYSTDKTKPQIKNIFFPHIAWQIN